jgi:UDP-N-acetylglucosamine 2-epimerase (non-hydrolysing)
LSDALFTPSEDADTNLRNEGTGSEKIHFVGNVMIDSLIRLMPLALQTANKELPEHYVLVTLHRPSNVDNVETLGSILESLLEVSQQLDVFFPVHPRTRQRIREFALKIDRLKLLEPVSYIEFLALQKSADVVITDSGGVQEETTYLGVPCLTVRENTERPITVTLGTNILVGHDRDTLKWELSKILAGRAKKGGIPPLWDGRAGVRIADILCRS